MRDVCQLSCWPTLASKFTEKFNALVGMIFHVVTPLKKFKVFLIRYFTGGDSSK